MKILNSKLLYFTIICAFFFQIELIADYSLSIKNVTRTSWNEIEFDVTIMSNNSDIMLSSYQCSITPISKPKYPKTIGFNYIQGSSEIGNFPIRSSHNFLKDGSLVLTFASSIGNDLITNQEIIIGRFKIIGFVGENILTQPTLKWNFNKVFNTILTDNHFNNITNPQNHVDFDLDFTHSPPGEFFLHQNYPNPFNPSTKIFFSIPIASLVKIVLYNSIGQKVKTIYETFTGSGKHQIIFKPEGLSSGIYIYTLETDYKIVASRKLVYIK